MWDHFAGIIALRQCDVATLIDAWHEPAAPVGRAIDRLALPEDDESRQVLILTPQAVKQPGAIRGSHRLKVAGEHHPIRRLMYGNVRVHGSDDAYVVRAS